MSPIISPSISYHPPPPTAYSARSASSSSSRSAQEDRERHDYWNTDRERERERQGERGGMEASPNGERERERGSRFPERQDLRGRENVGTGGGGGWGVGSGGQLIGGSAGGGFARSLGGTSSSGIGLTLLPSLDSFNHRNNQTDQLPPIHSSSSSSSMPPFSRSSSANQNPYHISSSSSSSSAASLSNLISPPSSTRFHPPPISTSSSSFYSSSSSLSSATTTTTPSFPSLRPSFSSYSPPSQQQQQQQPFLPSIKREPSDLSLTALYSPLPLITPLETHSYPSRRSSLSAGSTSGRSRAASLMQNPIGYPAEQRGGRERSGSGRKKGASNGSSPVIPPGEEKEEDGQGKGGDSGANRRLAHLQCEQRRRESINGGFSTLRSILPETTSSDSKALILQKAISYIQHLEQTLRLTQAPPAPPLTHHSSDGLTSTPKPTSPRSPPTKSRRATPPRFMDLDYSTLKLARRPDPTFSRPSSPPVSKAVTPNEMDWRARGELRELREGEGGMEMDMSDEEVDFPRSARGEYRATQEVRERSTSRMRGVEEKGGGEGRIEYAIPHQHSRSHSQVRTQASALDVLVGVAEKEQARFGGMGMGGGTGGVEIKKPTWAHYEREEEGVGRS